VGAFYGTIGLDERSACDHDEDFMGMNRMADDAGEATGPFPEKSKPARRRS